MNPPEPPNATPEPAPPPVAPDAATEATPAPAAEDAAPAPAAPTIEEQLAAARKEAAANYDRFLRAAADLENYRRRVVREKEEARQAAVANLMQHLLPVLDSLQLGLTAARPQAEAKTIADGVAIVLDQLKGVLGRHGLVGIDAAGQKFDPHRHEAVSHQPSATVPEGHVIQVVRAGYQLHGRLLRAASVVVSSGPAKEAK